jgi:tape measure domain-containing protein
MTTTSKFEIILAARDMTAKSIDKFEARIRRAAGAVLSLNGAMVAAAGGVALGKVLFDAGRRVEAMNKAIVEVSGSSEAAGREMAFLRETADDLGQSYYTLIDSYKGLLAASKGTILEGQGVRDIFFGVTKAAATLGLTSDQVHGSLNAIQQMMSKGKVQAEELRGQLGERLPGAFKLAAEAMGVSTQALNKMLDNGKVLAEDLLPKLGQLLSTRYSGDVAKSVRATNTLADAWMDLKIEMASPEFMESISGAMLDLAKTFRDPQFLSGMKLFADGMVRAAGAAVKFAKFISLWPMGRKILESGAEDQTGKRFKIVDPLAGLKRPGAAGPGTAAGGSGATWLDQGDEDLFGIGAMIEVLKVKQKELDGIVGRTDPIIGAIEDTWDIDLGNVTDGIEQDFGEWIQLSQRTADAMEDNFSDFFFDALKGELQTFGDYWIAFLDTLRRAVADYMGQIAKEMVFGDGTSGSSIFGKIASLGSLFAGGSSVAADPIGYDIDFGGFRAAGGAVDRGKTYIVGENGPELLTMGDNGSVSPGGGAVNFNVTVQAIDTQSGIQFLEAQSSNLAQMIVDKARYNPAIRNAFREAVQ